MSLRIAKVFDVIGTHTTSARENIGEYADSSAAAASSNSIGSSSRIGSSASLWLLPDNVSHACNNGGGHLLDGRQTESFCDASCPNGHLLWKTLRWVKLIAIKVGRSYYALPVALLLSVLLLGVCMGFILGRRYERQRQQTTTTSTRLLNNQLSTQDENADKSRNQSTSMLGRLCHWCGCRVAALSFSCHVLWLCVGRWTMFHRRRVKTTMDGTVSDESLSTVCESSIPLTAASTALPSFDVADVAVREQIARVELKSADETKRESNIPLDELPRHVAVIMDGNRRYGKQRYNNAMRGHWDGSRKLLQMAKWCIAEHISELTVYAFSTENWQRDAAEVSALMSLIVQHCEELRVEAMEQRICVRIKSTDAAAIPNHIRQALQQLEDETQRHHATVCPARLIMNICLSYGSRGEIVQACRTVAEQYKSGLVASTRDITEQTIGASMLIHSQPDILIRTSGEMRISNFMLWQLAYTELFFLDKNWPELEKLDFLQVLQSFARGRQRRFGK